MLKRSMAIIITVLFATLLCACGPVFDENRAPSSSDLTTLYGQELFYAAKYIAEHPQEYLDQTIKIKGQYRQTFDETNNIYYHFIEIYSTHKDNPSSISFEFEYQSIGFLPEHYPTPNDVITIEGTLTKIVDGDYTYYKIVAIKE